MDGWNTSFLLWWPMFRGYVSFRECISYWNRPFLGDMLVFGCVSWCGQESYVTHPDIAHPIRQAPPSQIRKESLDTLLVKVARGVSVCWNNLRVTCFVFFLQKRLAMLIRFPTYIRYIYLLIYHRKSWDGHISPYYVYLTKNNYSIRHRLFPSSPDPAYTRGI